MTTATNTDIFRPASLDEFLGQDQLKLRLQIRIDAAVVECRPLGHILLCGPPGAGKTSLASIIAAELGDEPMEAMTMPVPEKVLARTLAEFRGVLFLDELHRLGKAQELLLPVLEFGRMHCSDGTVIPTPWLTVLGATTEREKIIAPLYDRFSWCPEYDSYRPEDLRQIATSMAAKAGIELSSSTLLAIGEAAGGVPRNVGRLVLAARDLSAAIGHEPSIDEILYLAETQSDGLSESHMKYLSALHKLGGTAGVNRIAAMLRLAESVCLDLERLLVDQRLITFGGRGRELTAAGKRRIEQADRAAA